MGPVLKCKFIKKVIQIFRIIALVVISLVLVAQIFLWTSWGQTILGQKATDFLSNKLGTAVSVKKVDITLFKFFTLEEIYMADQNSDTLIYIDQLHFELQLEGRNS